VGDLRQKGLKFFIQKTKKKHTSKNCSFTPSPKKEPTGHPQNKFKTPSCFDDMSNIANTMRNKAIDSELISLEKAMVNRKSRAQTMKQDESPSNLKIELERTNNYKKYSYTQKVNNEAEETLSSKMSNFVKNYDDLIVIFNSSIKNPNENECTKTNSMHFKNTKYYSKNHLGVIDNNNSKKHFYSTKNIPNPNPSLSKQIL
jgi:hypothetical protein